MNTTIEELINKLKSNEMHYFKEAQIMQDILDQGITQTDLALKLNVSQSCVANKVRLLRLSEKVKRTCIDNDTPERFARALLRIDEEIVQLKVLGNLKKKKMNITAFEDLVRNVNKPVKQAGIMNKFATDLNKILRGLMLEGIKVKTGKAKGADYTDFTVRIYQ